MIIDITHALIELYPDGAGYIQEGVEYSGLTWTDKRVKPTSAEIDAEIVRLQAEYDSQEYARTRATEYPSVGDQLDMLMKDMKNGTTTHQEACEAVKAKYPKP